MANNSRFYENSKRRTCWIREKFGRQILRTFLELIANRRHFLCSSASSNVHFDCGAEWKNEKQRNSARTSKQLECVLQVMCLRGCFSSENYKSLNARWRVNFAISPETFLVVRWSTRRPLLRCQLSSQLSVVHFYDGIVASADYVLRVYALPSYFLMLTTGPLVYEAIKLTSQYWKRDGSMYYRCKRHHFIWRIHTGRKIKDPNKFTTI